MTKKEWIINELHNYDFDLNNLVTEENYERFIEDTGSNARFISFYKDAHKYRKELIENEKEEEDIELGYNENVGQIKNYSEEELVSILEEEIQNRGTSLSVSDVKQIAEERGIPYRAFLYQIPDLKSLLKQIYEVNLFHVETDKEVDKVKHENKKIKQELNHYKERTVKDEKLLETLDNIVQEYKPFKFQAPKINLNRVTKDKESVALFSDWHVDETVDYEQMLGINEYSISIAKKRIDKAFEGVIKNSQMFGITTVNLLFLGDMISGELHDLAENNERGVIKSIFELADYTSQHIRNLTRYFDKIKALGLVGNHPRTHTKPRYKNKQTENYEYILYEFIKREVKQFADFDLPESYMKIHEIQGERFLSLHGDIIKGGNGLNSIPGNLSRDVSLLDGTLSKNGNSFDWVNLAHFHNSNLTKSFSGAKVIMNSSLIGANEFSLGGLKKGEEPSQTWYLVERGIGPRFIDEMKVKE